MRSLPLNRLKKQRNWWGALLVGCSISGMALSYATSKEVTHIVVIEAMQFSPAKLEVKVGDTVVWENKDFFPHTVTSNDREFDSREIDSLEVSLFKLKPQTIYSVYVGNQPTPVAAFKTNPMGMANGTAIGPLREVVNLLNKADAGPARIVVMEGEAPANPNAVVLVSAI